MMSLKIFLFLWLANLHTSKSSEQKLATEPSDQIAVLGSTAVLPCRVVNRTGTVQWTRDGFGLGTIRGLRGFDRYSMIGSDDEGDYSLRISPVTLEDDADYQCQVSSPRSIPSRSRVARLTVFVPPQPPVITPGPTLNATAAVPVRLTCSSKGGRPAPEMLWLDSYGQALSGVNYIQQKMSDGKRVEAQAILNLVPNRHYDARTLTCLTSNQALSSPLAATIQLRVEYPPEVEMRIEPAELAEGVEARVFCDVDANPHNVTFRWFKGGMEVPSETSPNFSLGILKREDHGMPISCEATNLIGTVRKTQSLDVKYGPRFVSPPSSQSSEVNEEVSLKCRVDSNPLAHISWTHSGSTEIVSRGTELRLVASSKTEGLYECDVRVSGFSAIKGQLHLRLRGPPYITASSSIFTSDGDTVKIECDVNAVPHPITVKWSKKTSLLEPEKHSRITVDEIQKADGVLSVLTIRKITREDFDFYNCTAINEYGVDSHRIRLQREPLLPLIVVVGGGAGCVLIVIVVTIFIVCTRKCGITMKEKQKMAEAGRQMGMTDLHLQIPDNHSSAQESDSKEIDNRTASSMSQGDRDSDAWEKEVDKDVTKVVLKPVHASTRLSANSGVFPPPDQGYMSYVDYSRDYSPMAVPNSESYAQFSMVGPYARSTPASDAPSLLPSSVAPPPYTPSPSKNGIVANIVNGRLPTANGRVLNSLSSQPRIDVPYDLQPDLTREARVGLDQNNIHTKFILPPQGTPKPGTLV